MLLHKKYRNTVSISFLTLESLSKLKMKKHDHIFAVSGKSQPSLSYNIHKKLCVRHSHRNEVAPIDRE